MPRAFSPSGGRPLFTELADEARAHGYSVTVLFTNAILHGAPQSRSRFLFIAHKRRLDLCEDLLSERIRTVGEALEGLPALGELANHRAQEPTDLELKVMRELSPGESWGDAVRRIEARGESCRRSRFLSYRLRADRPSGALVDLEVLVHPVEDRYLTTREGARLCAYPDSFVFATDRRGRERNSDVTQAVLPCVGEYVAEAALRSLESPAQSPVFDLIDLRPRAKSLLRI